MRTQYASLPEISLHADTVCHPARYYAGNESHCPHKIRSLVLELKGARFGNKYSKILSTTKRGNYTIGFRMVVGWERMVVGWV
jgi:hypothetical protein